MSKLEYDRLGNTDKGWHCYSCLLPDFSDSLFSEGRNHDMSLSSTNDSVSEDEAPSQATNQGDENPDFDPHEAEEAAISFPELRDMRKRCIHNVIIAHININSFRYKYVALQEVLYDGLVDILAVQETKLDSSYTNTQFEVPGYRLYREDRNQHGGGIILYVRSDIPSRRVNIDLTHGENVTIELTVNKSKWLISSIYRPPKEIVKNFIDEMQNKT